jgi:hypothetical protein
MNDTLPTRRSPYIVTVRCMATGTDYTKRLFLKSRNDAFEVRARHVRLAFGVEGDALRVVEIV